MIGVGQSPEYEGGHDSEESEFKNGSAPSGNLSAPPGVDWAKKETEACADAEKPERFAGVQWIEPGDNGSSGWVKEAAPESGNDCGGDSETVGRRYADTDESKGVKKEAPPQKRLAAEAVSQMSHEEAWEKISGHDTRNQERGFPNVRQVEITLNLEIQGKKRDLICVGEGVQHAAQPQGADSMGVRRCGRVHSLRINL